MGIKKLVHQIAHMGRVKIGQNGSGTGERNKYLSAVLLVPLYRNPFIANDPVSIRANLCPNLFEVFNEKNLAGSSRSKSIPER